MLAEQAGRRFAQLGRAPSRSAPRPSRARPTGRPPHGPQVVDPVCPATRRSCKRERASPGRSSGSARQVCVQSGETHFQLERPLLDRVVGAAAGRRGGDRPLGLPTIADASTAAGPSRRRASGDGRAHPSQRRERRTRAALRRADTVGEDLPHGADSSLPTGHRQAPRRASISTLGARWRRVGSPESVLLPDRQARSPNGSASPGRRRSSSVPHFRHRLA